MPTRRKSEKKTVRLASRKKVGRFICKRRRELHLTQEDVRRALGYGSPISISEVELGRVGVPFRRIFQYADVLRLPREEFAAFVMGGIQNRNGHRPPKKDGRKPVLGATEQKLVEDFRRLPRNCKTRVRQQIRRYLAARPNHRRVSAREVTRRRST